MAHFKDLQPHKQFINYLWLERQREIYNCYSNKGITNLIVSFVSQLVLLRSFTEELQVKGGDWLKEETG